MRTIPERIARFLHTFGLMATLPFATSCSNHLYPGDLQGSEVNTSEQGGAGFTIQLPFGRDPTFQCVQGAGGSYSHTGTSTRFDLDFDTLNSVNQEVHAPVSGVAYVHLESATANFGYHVNVDVGDGNYVVLGHLKEVFVEDGMEVAEGQLLGYEGCTGLCTGDHVHIGLHQGDPAKKAEYGTSVSTSYTLEDASLGGTERTVASEDAVCDLVSGHFYRSTLQVPLWHPDGTLLKTPSSPMVYLVENGETRWVQDEDVFWSQGWNFDQVTLVSEEEFRCYGEGEHLLHEGNIEAVIDGETDDLWLAVGAFDDPARYRQRVRDTAWEYVLHSWGLSYAEDEPPPRLDAHSSFFDDYPERAGYATFRDGAIVREDSRSDVYVISDGYAMPVVDWDTFLLMGYGNREIYRLEDGDLAEVQDKIGDCALDFYCLDRDAVTVCGGGLELSDEDVGGTSEDDKECEDRDGDGHCSDDQGGDDCWDTNDMVYPGAIEICGDGVDQNCSGADDPCSPEDTDTDGDGVSDTEDNCIIHDNADQGDLDGDGKGDSCDDDADGDGVGNSVDCDMFDPLVGSCEESDTSEEEDEPPTDTSEPADEPADTGEPDEEPASTSTGTLIVGWATPFRAAATRITLSGEYIFADGSYGFTWRELAEVASDDDIALSLSGVGTGDTFRFSVEYEDAGGTVSWSCIGPYPPGTREGTASASVDGVAVSITEIGDPTGMTTGCGLFLTVP